MKKTRFYLDVEMTNKQLDKLCKAAENKEDVNLSKFFRGKEFSVDVFCGTGKGITQDKYTHIEMRQITE